jgi:hypothetical protein
VSRRPATKYVNSIMKFLHICIISSIATSQLSTEILIIICAEKNEEGQVIGHDLGTNLSKRIDLLGASQHHEVTVAMHTTSIDNECIKCLHSRGPELVCCGPQHTRIPKQYNSSLV